MRDKVVVSLLVVILLVLSGCTGAGRGGPFSKKSVEGEEDRPYEYRSHTGILGLDIEFVPKNPPYTIYYSGPSTSRPLTNVMVEIRNKGTHDIPEMPPSGGTLGHGYIYLSGYDKNIIHFEPDYQDYWYVKGLDGVSTFNPDGDYMIKEFTGKVEGIQGRGIWPVGTDRYTPILKVTLCYQYRTRANPVVCVDPYPFSPREDKACRVRNSYSFTGQGAPVAVTRIDEEATEDIINFRIDIANKGGGVVYNKNRVYSGNPQDPQCPFTLEYQDLNEVHYRVIMSKKPSLIECKPVSDTGEQIVRLVNDRAVIFCRFNNDAGVEFEFETPLQIELEYGYKNWKEKRVEIINVAGE